MAEEEEPAGGDEGTQAGTGGREGVASGMSGDEYVEAVLDLVERIPPGRVMSYGAVADALADGSGRRSPRRVGSIMARYGSAVPWHRVVAADGRLVPGHEERARRRHAAEGTPMRGGKIDMRAAAWYPDVDPPGAATAASAATATGAVMDNVSAPRRPGRGRPDGPARSRRR